MLGIYGEVFPYLLYAISAEVHFNCIHYLFTTQTMFSLVFMKIPIGQRLKPADATGVSSTNIKRLQKVTLDTDEAAFSN